MNERKGSIQVSTENIFPVIRQWLYTDRDIFMRELVSNAADAITKLERLRGLGEWDAEADPDYAIHVTYDAEAGTISIRDNGLGMTEAEIDEYINQIAYSGAMAFVEQYKDKGDAAG
ncbi:MAG: molecular chaperone HtpG, partial [Clostridiaceae bacterium]|nr:molecular chaperone HtpG [Clostridiaceae bacterium]